ncbi:hypothetical protein [Haladaptatus pallidirubidus]|nr:hypothetical protein [Haladaptatus pallidirubidus]
MSLPIAVESTVSSVLIAADYSTVWERITDPTNFLELYPHWTTSVEPEEEDHYRGIG